MSQTANLVTIRTPQGGTRRVNTINRALIALRKAQRRAETRHAGNPEKQARCLAAGSHTAQLWLTQRHRLIVR
jgi:hypothetical protein